MDALKEQKISKLKAPSTFFNLRLHSNSVRCKKLFKLFEFILYKKTFGESKKVQVEKLFVSKIATEKHVLNDIL